MKAFEELNAKGIYHCPECKCATGDDWEYKDFTNKRIVICPQYMDDCDGDEQIIGG